MRLPDRLSDRIGGDPGVEGVNETLEERHATGT